MQISLLRAVRLDAGLIDNAPREDGRILGGVLSTDSVYRLVDNVWAFRVSD
jgi:hypothetical protein